MLEEKQEIEIKRGIRYISKDASTNSRIYVNGLTMNKFLRCFCLMRNKELINVLKYIDEKEPSCCIKVYSLIYREDKFVGYSFKFYKDYKSLKRLFNKPFKLKKIGCKGIFKAFNELSNNNLEYMDIHRGNVLLDKKGECKICDLDEIEINELEEVKTRNKYKASILTLSYLYNIETHDILSLLKNQDSFLINNNNLLFDYFYDLKNGKDRDIDDLLNLITQKDIRVNKRHLKYSAKDLRGNPYFFKFYGY